MNVTQFRNVKVGAKIFNTTFVQGSLKIHHGTIGNFLRDQYLVIEPVILSEKHIATDYARVRNKGVLCNSTRTSIFLTYEDALNETLRDLAHQHIHDRKDNTIFAEVLRYQDKSAREILDLEAKVEKAIQHRLRVLKKDPDCRHIAENYDRIYHLRK